MVKNSRKLKKLLSVFLIMCLAASMLLTTSFASTDGTTATSTTPVTSSTGLSPLQSVIQEVLSKSFGERKNFVDQVLNGTDETKRIEKAKKLIDGLKDEDIKEALAAYDSGSNLSVTEKGYIGTFIKAGIPDEFNTSKFQNIAKKINTLVTNNPDGPKNVGIRITVAILDLASMINGGAVVKDADGNVENIKFVCNNIDKDTTMKDNFNALIKCIGTLWKKDIKDFDTLLSRAALAINDRTAYTNDTQKVSEISNFKLFLKTYSLRIYSGKYPTPAPTSGSGNGGSGGGVVDTPVATPVATPTSTATLAPTATSTTAPIPTPTVGKPSDKQITSFSFKDISGAKPGVIFEKLRTIVVPVPAGTNVKNLVPTIEYKGASIKPESGVKKNFSHPVYYTVTAADKSKAKYVVIVAPGQGMLIDPPEVKPGVGPYGDIFGHWAEDNLIGLIECGIITGYPDGSIKPNTHMTRAEVVTLIVKALGLSPAKDAKLSFKDSKIIPTWAQGYMKTALDKGFIKGYPDNTIKPMDKVTRAEFTVMIMKAFNVDLSKNEELKFKDAKAGIPDWAKQQIAAAVKLKIINGYKDNTFKPSNFITRAEVGAIIDRCFGVSGKSYPEL